MVCFLKNRIGSLAVHVLIFGLCCIGCDLLNNQEDSGGTEKGLRWIECRHTSIDTTTYYVSTDGYDEATGTDVHASFRTVRKALESVRPGGTIRIAPGVYEESLGLESCGGMDSTITITGYRGRPIFDGKNSRPIAFFCEGSAHVLFQHLEIRNYTDIGIGSTLSHHISFKDLIVYSNGHRVQLKDWEIEGYGIHVDESSQVLVENNNVFLNGPSPKVSPDRLLGTGINTYRITDSVIRGNDTHHNIGGGILVEDSEDVLVEDNEVYANDLDAMEDEWWDGGIWLDGGKDVTVRNNHFYDNMGPGIEISDEDRQNPTGYILENNHSHDNSYGIFIWNFGTIGWPDSTVLRRSGNVFIDNFRRDVWIVDWY